LLPKVKLIGSKPTVTKSASKDKIQKKVRQFMQCRRLFTLVELMVALALVGGIVALLLFTYRTTAMARGRIDKVLEPVRQRAALHHRLQDLFFHASTFQDSNHFFCITAEPALLLTYHYGIDPDRRFSGLVLGKLYLDGGGRLVFATWPLPQYHDEHREPPCRQEVLFSGVDELEIEGLQRATRLPVQTNSIQTGGQPPILTAGWHSLWPKEDKEGPALVRLTLVKNSHRESFTYTVHGSSKTPTYFKERP
jgi:hypothetical protein